MTISPADVLARYRTLSLLGNVQSLVHWDFETMLPSGGAADRQAQMVALASIVHAQWTDPKLLDDVQTCLAGADATPADQTQLQRFRKQLLFATAVDQQFTERMAAAQADCHHRWQHAKKNGEPFATVAGALATLIDMTHEWVDRIQAHPVLAPTYYAQSGRYDILLDQYEPGMPGTQILGLLRELTQAFPRDAIAALQERTAAATGDWSMPLAQQHAVARDAIHALGFDWTRGRFDTSTHPFCGGPGGDDVRITSRYREDRWMPAVFGALHETGHGLYEQGLPAHLRHTPCGGSASMGIHESQSRFFENCMGRSRAGCEWLARLVGCNADALYRTVTHINPSFIRVDADEVTYNLHILIRAELEQAIVSKQLLVADIAEAWDDAYERILGIRPRTPAEGCMQDTHWYHGLLGYFPTYSLGNLLAAELFADFRALHPDWEIHIARGDFSAPRAFMAERIYPHAALHDSPTTIQHAIGRPLGTTAFVEYVREKYA